MKVLFALLLLAATALAENPRIEIRRPHAPSPPDQIQFWAQVPNAATQLWQFQVSDDMITWRAAGNETAFPDGWRYFETRASAYPRIFVRLKCTCP